jgi:hypothetical protein
MSDKRKLKMKGSVLAYVLVIMTVVSMLLVSILTFISSQIKNGAYVAGREQAFQVAEQGIQFYKWYLAHQTDGRTAQQIEAFWNSGTAYGVGSDYVADVADPSGGIMGSYRLRVTPPTTGSTIIQVESVGEMDRYSGKTRTIKVRFRRPSWSESAVLANDEMRFGEGTETFGKVHSNLGVRFDGYAHNVVTSAVTSYNDPDHTGNNEFAVHTHVVGSGVNDSFRSSEAPPNAVPARTDVFSAGREFPVSSVDFNGVLGDLSFMKSEAQAGHGKFFAEDSSDSGDLGRRIILRTDGTYDTCRVRTVSNDSVTQYKRKNSSVSNCSGCGMSSNPNCTSNFPIPNNGIIFVEDDVWLSGQVSGRKVTVVAANLTGSGASRSLYIPNDIRYTNYDGTDIIGAIAQQDVSIPLESETDLRVDAALIAQNGRVGRPNYGSSDHKNVITVFGAIATNQRYGFAWTGGFGDWGYDTRNLYYDNNLLYYPPPYFPTGTQYLVDLWEEL